MHEHELNEEELAAINELHELAKRWPKSLQLFANTGTLEVLSSEKAKLYNGSRWSHEQAVVARIHGIYADGGDP